MLHVAMNNHSGMQPTEGWDNMFRQYTATGLDKDIAKMAITPCIDWENKSYTELVIHTKHAERILQQPKEK